MEVRAVSRSVRISPRKLRLVADAVRNMPIEQAMDALQVLPQRGRIPVEKTLKSAVANAVNNAKLEQHKLLVSRINVTEGPAFRRFRPSTRGRVHPYKKRSSHLEIVLAEKEDK